jgi:organic radical activating enzyme
LVGRALRALRRRTREYLRPSVIFQVKLTDHCNLDCVCCNTYAPICEKFYLDLNSYEQDIERVREIFSDRCEVILSGGEPLLHPDVIEFFHKTRALLPKAKISLVTNGMLVQRQTEEFWRALREEHVALRVTKYPIKVDYEAIREQCAKQGVEFAYHNENEAKEEAKASMIIQGIDPKGSGDPERNYRRCSVRHCTTLRDGKLYPCFVVANIHHFNKYFGYDIPVSEADRVDVYRARSAHRVRRRLYNRKQPLDFCRYCDIDMKLVSCVEYTRSKKQISEWVNSDKLTS